MKKVQKTIFRTEDEVKLDKLVEKSNRVILKISTVFPFDFFPNDLIISENQVDVVLREFFYSEHIETILLEDIQQVAVETSLFFASLSISMLKPESSSLIIPYFRRSEAIQARRIIYGLMAVFKEKIEIENLNSATLMQKLEMIGKDYDD